MKLIPMSITRSFGRTVLKAKKNSPHIFFVAGVVGTIGSTVLACRATLKLEPVLDEIKQDLDSVKGLNEISKDKDTDYQEHEYFKDLGYVYSKSFVKVTKLYGPAVGVGIVSISALAGSHIQLTRRNAALTVALSAVSKAFEEYRVRVQKEIGEDKELEIYHDVKEVEIIGENGKKELVKAVDGMPSPYARFFDEYSPSWEKNEEYNRLFLQAQQNYANHKLQAVGHVFLNEVYDSLGLERSRIGAIVGWVLGSKEGDNYIDFGVYNTYDSRFVNQIERSVLLDFNVDGVIYDKI